MLDFQPYLRRPISDVGRLKVPNLSNRGCGSESSIWPSMKGTRLRTYTKLMKLGCPVARLLELSSPSDVTSEFWALCLGDKGTGSERGSGRTREL